MNWKLILMVIMIIILIIASIVGVHYGIRAWKQRKHDNRILALQSYRDLAQDHAITRNRDNFSGWPNHLTQLDSLINTADTEFAESGDMSYSSDTKAALRAWGDEASAKVNWARNLEMDPSGTLGSDVIKEWRDFIKASDGIKSYIRTNF